MKYTITKVYPEIPIAHRQHKHSGHCAFIHGHNWSFFLCIGADVKDENDFVFDFGKLGFVKEILAGLDHSIIINQDDNLFFEMYERDIDFQPMFKVNILPSGSAEGIAQYVFERVQPILHNLTEGRCRLEYVQVAEDSKNSANYTWENYASRS